MLFVRPLNRRLLFHMSRPVTYCRHVTSSNQSKANRAVLFSKHCLYVFHFCRCFTFQKSPVHEFPEGLAQVQPFEVNILAKDLYDGPDVRTRINMFNTTLCHIISQSLNKLNNDMTTPLVNTFSKNHCLYYYEYYLIYSFNLMVLTHVIVAYHQSL